MLHENEEYANKINELVASNNELLAEVHRLRNLVQDIADETPLRLVFAWHIRRTFPTLSRPVGPMDVPPVPVTPHVPTPMRKTTLSGDSVPARNWPEDSIRSIARRVENE